MEQDMDITFDVEMGTPPEHEDSSITERRGEFSPPGNVPITNLSTPIVIEKHSIHNTFYVGPSRSVFYQPPPGYLVVTMFCPSAPL